MRIDSWCHLASVGRHDPPRRPLLQVPDRLEQVQPLRRQAVFDRYGPIQVDLPFRDPDLLELLQRLREGALADPRRDPKLVEALRPGQETVRTVRLREEAITSKAIVAPHPGPTHGLGSSVMASVSRTHIWGVPVIYSFVFIPRFR